MADGSAVVDQTWSTTANPIDPYSYTRSKMFGEVIFDLLKNTVLKMGYSFASIERKGGFEEELAVLVGPGSQNKTDEKTFKISLDSNPLDWLLLRVSYLSAARTWSLDGKVDIYAAGGMVRISPGPSVMYALPQVMTVGTVGAEWSFRTTRPLRNVQVIVKGKATGKVYARKKFGRLLPSELQKIKVRPAVEEDLEVSCHE